MSSREREGSERFFTLSSDVARALLAALLLTALVLMAFFAAEMDYSCGKTFLVPNAVLIPLCLVATLVAVWLFLGGRGSMLRHAISSGGRKVDASVLLATIILFVVQVRICKSYAFETGWDSGMLSNSSWMLSQGGELDGWSLSYFSRYPNNLFLLWVAEQCMRLARALGATSALGGVYVFSALNCASAGLAAWLTYRCASVVATRAWGLVSWLLCVLLVGTSPWAGILYSDCVVVCVPAAILLCFVRMRQSNGFRRAGWWALMGFVAVIGYKIKPQVLFPFLAIVTLGVTMTLWKAWRSRGGPQRPDVCSGALTVAVLGVACALALGLVSAATSSLGLALDENAQFSPAHYLMMGLNDETRGVYLESDVIYSQSFPDQASRTRGNLTVIGERLREYGPAGFVALMADKLMTNLADGTFAWGMEGGFFNAATTANVDGALARATRSLYYPDGSNLDLFKTFAQAVWLFVLVGCVLACVLPLDRQGEGVRALVAAAALSLLILIGFELLFEARARYLFSSLAVFIFLATLGLRSLYMALSTLRASCPMASVYHR